MLVQKTVYIKPKDSSKKWVLIDAKGLTLGRLAAEISHILQGKNKPDYTPYWDNGDNVIVINSKYIKVTGNKMKDKKYYWHTGFPGGIKERTYEKMIQRDPNKPLYIAVKGMLPKNKLARKLLGNMKIYADENHPHQAQNPVTIEIKE